MNIVNPANIRMWSMLGSRGTFGTCMLEVAKDNEKVIALAADLTTTAGLDRFRKEFPDRMINTGIAEQNMIGMASAFANEGYVPFAVSFANFSTLRACETVRHFLGYMHCNVKLVGLSAGFAMGMFGNTHYGMEDMGVIRTIPGITILSPADCTEVVKATEAAARFNGPVYIRLTGIMNNPVVYKEDYTFEIGKAISLLKGSDVTIITTGTMVYNAIKAAALLKEKGISAGVIDMHTIKPLDVEIIKNEAISSKLIVTVEEHSKINGLGGAVAEYLSTFSCHPALLKIGIDDNFKHAGDYKFMLSQNGLLPEQIAVSIEKKMTTII
ncbi:MAG: 1-deoxy-D-xylulose-5-phosphate synthase [Bacteroidetes bacterium ADurb.Bin408]|nr:MAG: 1-deoxy-D-xylulose-5-phosphate synthase [Bacteroidetes bacterium ADurb.Bin408]